LTVSALSNAISFVDLTDSETLDFFIGVFPANVKTTKTYYYQGGELAGITYT
jgi:hypothetical protein